MAQINGNGDSGQVNSNSIDVGISHIVQALDLIHNPSTPNDQRLEALQHLDRVKQRDNIAQIGHLLGGDPSRPPMIRHFGLSLLGHVIQHQWHQLSDQHSEQFRNLILELAQTLEQTPQAFIRNKIAELWIELAKKSWALDWYGLDECLVQLWSANKVGKEFSLSVLENLSADVFEREDNTAILRGKDLNSAVVEIFASAATFTGGFKVGDVTQHVRYGDQGWLVRITSFLEQSLQDNSITSSSQSTAIAALSTLRSAFTWATIPPIVNAQCLPAVCMCLTRQNPDIILAALDVLNSLYGRSRMDEVEVQALVYPLCQPDSITTLEQVYTWSVIGVDEMDSPKYTISKKVAELMAHLTEWLIHFNVPGDVDFNSFLELLLAVAQHDSLIVSIPAVDSWDKIVQSSKWRRTAAVQEFIRPVLYFATHRVIQYDQIPEEAQEAAVMFVNEEIELHPDRQAFYMMYRRFCISIIDWITYKFLDQALDFLLSQVDTALNYISKAESPFDPSQYHRTSIALLKVDAQFTIVDAAFRGVSRWTSLHAEDQHIQQKTTLVNRMKSWSLSMLSEIEFKDPLMRQRQIKHSVETSNKILGSDTAFAFKVLEHILSSFLPLLPEYQVYSETVAELHSYASAELRRLALEHASYFVTFYDQLEAKFVELAANGNVDEKVQIDLRSSLFLIVQRAQGLDSDLRKARLGTFLSPIGAAWDNHQNLLSSFDAFAQSQAFDQVGPFLSSSRVSEQPDWSAVTFGPDGVQVQETMASGAAKLPLRETRVLLSVSTDRLEQDAELRKTICELWVPMLPIVLQSVLLLVGYNHRLHDTSAWPNVTPEMRPTIQRILRDRYWQSGISEGSMTEFHKKVKSTKSTVEGFASSVRGRIRTNLENCYSIIHTLGRLGSYFYGMPEIPDVISERLLKSSTTLGLHHFGTLLSMLPKLIEECPAESRQHFLTPVISTLLEVMDSKCTGEWQKLETRQDSNKPDDSLNDEMREESVLRQMTYRAVNMVSIWLDPQREAKMNQYVRQMNGHQTQQQDQNLPSMRDFILSNLRILEPLLVFCTHALTYKDTKACATMAAALQRLVPVYAYEGHLQGQEAAAVREFISTEMLRTLITSLHDGYFADYQDKLATLIALIWIAYGLPAHVVATETQPAHDRAAWTSTPRQVLLSLPGMTEAKVDQAGAQLAAEGINGKARKLRAIVLHLLEGVRGVRISELGKIDMKVQQSKILEKYKQREQAAMQGMEGETRSGDDGIDLGGVADMFGE